MCTWETFLENDTMFRMKKILRCSHCEETLQDPITLMCCQHNFCMLCLEEIKAKQTNPEPGVLCPVCKEFSSENKIRQHHIVVKIVEFHNMAEKEKEKRDAIRRRQELKSAPDPAKWKCMDCPVYMCDCCKEKHTKVPLLTGHYIIPLAQKDNTVTTGKHRDRIAPSEYNIKHYCVDCDEGICNRHSGLKDRKLSTIHSERTSTKNGFELGTPDVGLELERLVTMERDSFNMCKEALDRSLEEKIDQLQRGHARSLRRLMIEHEKQMLEMEENCQQLEQRERERRELTEITPKPRQQASDRPFDAAKQVALYNKMTNGALLKTLDEARKNGSRNLLVQVVKTKSSEERDRILKEGYLGHVGYLSEELILPPNIDDLAALDTDDETNE